MIYTNLTYKALYLALKFHQRQVDKEGYPYILHCLRVAEKMPDEISTAAALLHDILEDTDITGDDLQYIPFAVLKPVTIVTRIEEETYEQYINRIVQSKDEVAIAIKIADLEDHLRPTDNSEILSLQKRYVKYLKRLKGE